MNVRVTLNKIRYIHHRIRQEELKVESLRSALLPSGISYDNDRVQTTPDDQMAKVVAMVIEASQEHDRLIKVELPKATLEVTSLIDTIEDDRYRTTLYLWYVGMHDVDYISEAMGYERDTIYKFKRKAENVLNNTNES